MLTRRAGPCYNTDVVPKTESLVWQALQALCGILIELFYPHSLQSNGGDVILAMIIALSQN